MIKAFIFDIGNVLLRFDFSIAMGRLAQRMDPISAEVLASIEPIKIAYESGQLDRPNFLQRLGEVISYTGTEPEFVSAWEDIFSENTPMIEIVEALHGHYPLYLLSNTSDLHVNFIFRKFPVFGLFEDAVYSFRVKSMKPSTEIFEKAIQQFGVTPSETVFIDDLAPNVATARELGFHAIQYDPADHGAFVHELDLLHVRREFQREISA